MRIVISFTGATQCWETFLFHGYHKLEKTDYFIQEGKGFFSKRRRKLEKL